VTGLSLSFSPFETTFVGFALPEWSAYGNRLELSLFLRRLAFAVLLDDVAISLFFFAILSFV